MPIRPKSSTFEPYAIVDEFVSHKEEKMATVPNPPRGMMREEIEISITVPDTGGRYYKATVRGEIRNDGQDITEEQAVALGNYLRSMAYLQVLEAKTGLK